MAVMTGSGRTLNSVFGQTLNNLGLVQEGILLFEGCRVTGSPVIKQHQNVGLIQHSRLKSKYIT